MFTISSPLPRTRWMRCILGTLLRNQLFSHALPQNVIELNFYAVLRAVVTFTFGQSRLMLKCLFNRLAYLYQHTSIHTRK